MRTKLYQFRGQRWLMNELAEASGIPAGTIHKRITLGWTIEQAVVTPSLKQRRAGVVSNLAAFEGTGAGTVLQEMPEITFSKDH